MYGLFRTFKCVKLWTACLILILISFCGKKTEVFLLTESKCIIKDQRFQPVSMTVVPGNTIKLVSCVGVEGHLKRSNRRDTPCMAVFRPL